jgi:hypothetical protein
MVRIIQNSDIKFDIKSFCNDLRTKFEDFTIERFEILDNYEYQESNGIFG